MISAAKSVIAMAAAAMLLLACQDNAKEVPADLVLTNAFVYTADSSRTVAEAVAIRGNEIVFVGANADIAPFIGDATIRRDLGGAMVMPGLHDMHIHALGTVPPDTCDLDSKPYSLEALVPVLTECISRYEIAPGDWLIVLQWNFSGGNQPSAELPHIRAALDAVSTEHPVFLYGNDGHHGAANSMALAFARNKAGETVALNADTLMSDYAEFQPMIAVDANGEPTGGINEDARMLIRHAWFEDMLGMNGDLDNTLSRVAMKMAANGITTLQDAIVTPETLAAYGRLEERKEMTFRFRAAMVEPPSENIADIDAHLLNLITLRQKYSEYEFVAADGVKLFADAVLEGNPLTQPPTMPVAALLDNFKQPIFGGKLEDGTFDVVGYVDQDREVCQQVQAEPSAYAAAGRIDSFVAEFGFYPQQCIPYNGVLEHDEAYLRAYIRKATEAGFHVHVHALSDKGVRIAVDELGKVKSLADRNGTSQSLAHVQLAHPDDQKRIGELGIGVVFTFVWATPGVQYDMMVVPFIEEISGVADLYNPDTYYYKNVYPAKTIQDYGGLLVNGSDAPVGSRDPMPFVSLQQALTRSNGEVVLNESQRIDIHSAIAAFTTNGAKLFGHDKRVGTIEAGKLADLIAIDRNIVELAEAGEPQEIGGTRVTMTIFNGRVVHEDTG
jgi:predicted amidohydrolase YtcJ